MKSLLLLLVLLSACGAKEPPTAVLLRISAQGSALDAKAVRVRVLGGMPDGASGALVEQRVVDLPTKDGWPIEIAVEPKNGDASRKWRVEAWGLLDDEQLGAGVAEDGFTAGKIVEASLLLKPGANIGDLPRPGASMADAGGDVVDAGTDVVDGAVEEVVDTLDAGAGSTSTSDGGQDSGALPHTLFQGKWAITERLSYNCGAAIDASKPPTRLAVIIEGDYAYMENGSSSWVFDGFDGDTYTASLALYDFSSPRKLTGYFKLRLNLVSPTEITGTIALSPCPSGEPYVDSLQGTRQY